MLHLKFLLALVTLDLLTSEHSFEVYDRRNEIVDRTIDSLRKGE